MSITEITDRLLANIKSLKFAKPVTHVYNPLEYARLPYDNYLSLYGKSPKEILLLGMNPGPFGMAQTGVPFGEVEAVKSWLKIETDVQQPPAVHPKRPIEGFACKRSEVSGKRVWGWAKNQFETPDRFFERFLVLNYCPLVFMEESSRNRTPDKLPKTEKEELFQACNQALLESVEYYDPRYVIGVGAFAEKRAKEALKGHGVNIGRITHPSPANPKANKGWESIIMQELSQLGILD